ncbi:MAG TPA: DUF2637 domain-containing protein [Streptosporangiaceae bacterium]
MALYGIGVIALAGSVDALAHSYAGLYGWGLHHRLGGWQAWSWPAEIDVFLVVGELALYIAYLDAWPRRQRLWPWVTAVVGLLVSVAGNVGHIQPLPDATVTLADRLTAATSPVAAFAGLMIGLLVLKMNRDRAANASGQQSAELSIEPVAVSSLTLEAAPPAGEDLTALPMKPGSLQAYRDPQLLQDATRILEEAHASGRKVSQRALATQLRKRGHRFSNAQLRNIAGVAAEASSVPDRQAA